MVSFGLKFPTEIAPYIGVIELSKSKKSKRSKKDKKSSTPVAEPKPEVRRPVPPKGPGLDLSRLTNSTPDVRDLDRELAYCLATPNRRDAECVRLLVGHVVTDKLRQLEKNSRLGETNKALLADAIAILIKLTV